MGMLYSPKDTCLRIVVTYENQCRMLPHMEAAGQPLFALKKKQHYSVKFEHKTITASFQKQKKVYSARQIVKAETLADGLRIMLDDGSCIGIAPQEGEKHNTALFDITIWLRRYCRSRFFGKTPIVYPTEEDSGRYKSQHLPQQQLPFCLTDSEIRRILLYQLLIQKRGIFFVAVALICLVEAVFTRQAIMLVPAAVVTALGIVLNLSYFHNKNAFVQNHRGQLRLMLYEDCLVVRLQITDLELEYEKLRPQQPLFGLLRLQCGRFFTLLLLPKRLTEEDPRFFEALDAKIRSSPGH